MENGKLGLKYNITKANRTDGRVQNLAAHINVQWLITIHGKMDRHKATGIDGVTKDEYEANLEGNLKNLVERMKSAICAGRRPVMRFKTASRRCQNGHLF